MNIDPSTITHYFCLAPRSFADRFRSTQDGPLWVYLGPGIGPDQWKQFIGISPAMESVLIADYDDREQLIFSTALHKIGITCDPLKFQKSDPSIFFCLHELRAPEAGSPMKQVAIGFAYRVPGGPFVTNSGKPATFKTAAEAEEERRAEEAKRAKEAKRAEEERKRKIQSNREASRVCMMCGKPLGFFQRLSRAKQHKGCTTFTE